MKEYDPVDYAFTRLTEEAYGDMKRMKAMSNVLFEQIQELYKDARKEGHSENVAMSIALTSGLNSVILSSKINISISRKMLGILYKWLPEGGMREASTELGKLKLDDVLKEYE